MKNIFPKILEMESKKEIVSKKNGVNTRYK